MVAPTGFKLKFELSALRNANVLKPQFTVHYKEKIRKQMLSDFYGVGNGIRTHGLQGHNLAL